MSTKHFVRIEVADYAALPLTGENNVIYQTLDTELYYMFANGVWRLVGESDFSGDYNDLTNLPTLATVATTGDYNDLINLPGDPDPLAPPAAPLIFADVATVAALPTNTYYNGIANDGVGATLTATVNGSLALIDDVDANVLETRILVKNESAGLRNGVYAVTQIGDISNPWILTRVEEADEDAELAPLQVNILSGTVNIGTYYYQTADPVTVGTTALTFISFTPATTTQEVMHVDTVSTAPLPTCYYVPGSAYPVTLPAYGAYLNATANGDLGVINGVTMVAGSKILVSGQANLKHNGDYIVVNAGSPTTKWKLQRISYRSIDFDLQHREWKVNNNSSILYGEKYAIDSSIVLDNAGLGSTIDLYFVQPPPPAPTFTNLIDTPADYVGAALQAVRVTAGEDGLEFYTPVVAGSGKFGIADSSGVYTYYTTLTLAMTAATSGQTIEFFTDYTETGAVTITLKDGVTINGNGHTYTYTSTTGDCFQGGNNTTFNFYNLKIVRSNTTPTGAYVFYATGTNGTNLTINFSGTYVFYLFTTSTGATPIFWNDSNVTLNIKGLYANANGSGTVVRFTGGTANGTILDSTIIATGTADCLALLDNSKADNCSISSNSGNGVLFGVSSIISNSRVITETGSALKTNTPNFVYGTANHCYAYSRTYVAAFSIFCNNCVLVSDSGLASYSSDVTNSHLEVKTFNVVNSDNSNQPKFTNCSLVSYLQAAINSNLGVTLNNCSVESKWNSASGHAAQLDDSFGAVSYIKNTSLKVANTGANCIVGISPISIYYANNVFEGATTPVNANVTQLVVNTHDSQGNILI